MHNKNGKTMLDNSEYVYTISGIRLKIAYVITTHYLCVICSTFTRSPQCLLETFSLNSLKGSILEDGKNFWILGYTLPPTSPPFYRQNPQRSIWQDIWGLKQIKQFFFGQFWKVTCCNRRYVLHRNPNITEAATKLLIKRLLKASHSCSVFSVSCLK